MIGTSLQSWPVSNARMAAACLMLGILCFALRSWVPFLPWLLPATFVAIWLSNELRRVPAQHLKYLLSITGGVTAGHCLMLMSRSAYNPSAQTVWRDDGGYFLQATALAHAWRSDVFPEISRKGSELYFMGTLHTGYQRALAAVFYVFGSSVFAGLLLNVVSAAILPVSTYLLTRDLEFTNAKHSSRLLLTPAIIAALLAAFHPSQFYWSQFLLKDLFVATWFVTALSLLVAAVVRRDALATIAFLAALYVLYTLRVYCAAALVLAAVAYAVVKLPRVAAWSLLATGVLLFMMLVTYTDIGAARFNQMWSSLVELGPRSIQTPWQIPKHILAGIPRLALGPFAWLAGRGTYPLYGLYPGMWFLYLLVYPAAIVGVVFAIRTNMKTATIPIIAGVAGALILLLSSYGGDASRQRYYMEYICIAFAAYGWTLSKRRTFLVYYAALAAYIVGQVITVKVRGL